jgi:uncharacterized membrane protein
MPKQPTAKFLNIQKWYPWILAVAAAVGFFASFTLTIEKYELLKNPQHHLSCSISPLLTCGPIINSHQASAFGFPNPLIGVFAYGVLFAVAMGMFGGAVVDKAKRWYWRLYMAGHLFGLGFIAWLISQALYELKALCIYCMVAWAMTIALNWYGFLWLSATGRLKVSAGVAKFRDWGLRNHWGVVLVSYLVIFVMIFFAFRAYFRTVWF